METIETTKTERRCVQVAYAVHMRINNTARDQHGTSCSHARVINQGGQTDRVRIHGRDRRTTEREECDRNEMKLVEMFGDVQQFDQKHQEPRTN